MCIVFTLNLPCAQILSEVRVKVGRGIVIPTKKEVELLAVEVGASVALPWSDMLPILSRTSTYVSLPLYRGRHICPLPKRCTRATVEYCEWWHWLFPAGNMVTTTTGVAAAGTRSHATSLGRGRGRSVFLPNTYWGALGNGSRRRRRSSGGVGARKTGQGWGMNCHCRCLVVT